MLLFILTFISLNFFRPTVIIAIVLWCFQLFLGHFVFRDRTLPKITITVNNRFVFTPYNLFISRTYQLSKKKRKKTNLQTKQL